MGLSPGARYIVQGPALADYQALVSLLACNQKLANVTSKKDGATLYKRWLDGKVDVQGV